MFGLSEQETASLFDAALPVRLSGSLETATQTINLNSLFSTDIHSTGSFDLRSIGTTAFGKLLDSLPLPAFVIDQWYQVVFCNQACTRIVESGLDMLGASFLDLLPRSDDTEKVRTLAEKAEALLDRAFLNRRPQRAEAILEIEGRKIWVRLHLRCVRMASQRHLLVLMEDLTTERALNRLSKREENRLKQSQEILTRQTEKMAAELKAQQARLQQQGLQTREAYEAARASQERFQELARLVPSGIVVLSKDGRVVELNEKFTELFGYELPDLPDTMAIINSMFPSKEPRQLDGRHWFETHSSSAEPLIGPLTVTVRCKDGSRRTADVKLARLGNGDHLMTCEEISLAC